MRALGLLLFVVGTAIATSYAARAVTFEGAQPSALDRLSAWAELAGIPFAIGLAVMIAGGILARQSVRAAGAAPKDDRPYRGDLPSREQAGVAKDLLSTIEGSVSELPHKIDASADAAALHAILDRILEEEVPLFLDTRKTLIDQLGLTGYASIMSPFASFERNLARAWSALTDECHAEAATSLSTARDALDSARAELERALSAASPGTP